MEAIAENTHDIWARQRMDEGWQYGEKRDDDLKLHPDLVPFSDLTDSDNESINLKTVKLCRTTFNSSLPTTKASTIT